MYDGYYAIAHAYDKFNADIDYDRWSDFMEACFDRYLPARPRIVLDLACGTGRMTFPLADRGYDMIGIDGSADMLAEAVDKNADRSDRLYEKACADLGFDPDEPDPDGKQFEAAMRQMATYGTPPLFLEQDMRSFELYGTVDAVVCCLDSLNYLCEDGDLDACLSCIHLYLAPGGLLIFDVNSPYKFEHIYGNNAYVLEDVLTDTHGQEERKIFCGWQNEYDPATRLCHFYLSMFTEQADGRYTRTDEEQTERCYTLDELSAALDKAGFDLCDVCSDLNFSPVHDTAERLYMIARTRKTGDWYLCK